MTTVSPFEGARLVLFDLDGTLLKTRPSSVEAFIAYGAEAGLKLDAEARLTAVRWNDEHWARNRALIRQDEEQLGQEGFMEKHLRLFLRSTGMADGLREEIVAHILARFRDDFSPQQYLEPGAHALLRGLREAGLRLGLVSNRDGPLTDLAAEFGMVEHFDFMLAAGQVNSWKPEAAIFRHALRMGGGVPPGQAVHVGDSYYADVVGARAVGMAAVLVDEYGAFPEARNECLVISQLGDLVGALPGGSLTAGDE